MNPAIRQTLEQLEALHNLASAQLRSMAEQRRHLEEKRRRILLQLEEPGDSTPDLHRTLATIDEELGRRRQQERELRTQTQTSIDALGQEMLSISAARRQALTEELRDAQAQSDHLRDELIPEARRYIDDLEARQRTFTSRSVTLANQLTELNNEIPDLSRFDLSE